MCARTHTRCAAARRRRKDLGVPLEVGLSGVQVAEREHLSPDDLIERLEVMAPKAVKGRSRVPRLMRAVKIGIDAPVVEKWSFGYLIDIIDLRDAWMHRLDTARATGADLDLTAGHDGRIVADDVAGLADGSKPHRLTIGRCAGGGEPDERRVLLRAIPARRGRRSGWITATATSEAESAVP